MKHALPTLLIFALPGLATAQDLTAHGNFRHMMHSGGTSGTVALDTLDAPSAWGVGATAGLRGEIVLRDGEVLVSRGSDPEARLTAPEPGEEAAILAHGTVADWHAVPLPDPAEDDAGAMTTPADPREAGQSAFAAIQEIVAHLMADPDTDWASVDIEALRQHLVDMDNVTLRARVETQPVDGGARFVVTSDDPTVTASIRAMVPAHAATMDGVEGWHLSAEPAEGGAILTATGNDEAEPRIRGLGFIGLMTVGMHHPAHHLAIATGQAPHAHHDGHQHRAQD